MKIASNKLITANQQLANIVNLVGQTMANKHHVKVNQMSRSMIGFVDANRQVVINISIRNLNDPVFRAQHVFIPEQNEGNNNDTGGNGNNNDNYPGCYYPQYPDNGNGNNNYPQYPDDDNDYYNGNGNNYPHVPVESIVLSEDSISLIINYDNGVPVYESLQLTANILPYDASNKGIMWEVDYNGIATVNQYGVVTAVSEGTATVGVTTLDGNFTATCEVVVADMTTYNPD